MGRPPTLQAFRARVESLLVVHEQEREFLESAAECSLAERQPSISEGTGRHIGRYKLLQKIGEGGFGVVYMAEQERPVRRKVAIKIIKPGMDIEGAIMLSRTHGESDLVHGQFRMLKEYLTQSFEG
jgi:hypothetical protein